MPSKPGSKGRKAKKEKGVIGKNTKKKSTSKGKSRGETKSTKRAPQKKPRAFFEVRLRRKRCRILHRGWKRGAEPEVKEAGQVGERDGGGARAKLGLEGLQRGHRGKKEKEISEKKEGSWGGGCKATKKKALTNKI